MILSRLEVLAKASDGGSVVKSGNILKVVLVDWVTSTQGVTWSISEANVTFLFPFDGFSLELLENLFTL